jgi:hypothetical protein
MVFGPRKLKAKVLGCPAVSAFGLFVDSSAGGLG